jgi:UDP-glucose 4-epimerase
MVAESKPGFRRILITGGCGFIGTSLVSHLLNNGLNTHIRVLDNLSVGTREALSEVCDVREVNSSSMSADIPSGTVELVTGDIRDPDMCVLCCRDTDAVVHLAAQSGVPVSVENPQLDCAINVTGTLNMLEACRKNNAGAFVFASSGAPLGEVEPPIHEQKVPRPVSPYGASKLAGEAYCSSYYKTFGVKTVVLRFGNVYGPGSQHKTSIVAKFFRHALNGKPLEIYGDGTQTRDFIYISDLCNAISLSLTALIPAVNGNGHTVSNSDVVAGEIFQIATFRETTVSEIAEKIKVLIKRDIGKTVSIIHGEKRTGDVQRNYSDISKAKKLLGFQPLYDLDAGLYETWQSFAHDLKRLNNAKASFHALS